MKKRWEAIAQQLETQNAEPSVKCLRQLLMVSHAVSKYLDEEFFASGLNQTQRRIINFLLCHREPMSVTELSKITFLTLDAVKKSIDGLDKKSMTRSYRAENDRRVRIVELTEKGFESIEENMVNRHRVFSLLTHTLDTDEIAQLSDLLHKMSKQFSDKDLPGLPEN